MVELLLDDVRVVKLTTGEVVVGFQSSMREDLEENPELDNYIVLQHPYLVECGVINKSETQPSFAINCYRYMPFIQDDAILIQKHNIIAIGIPDDSLIHCYGSLIEMAFGMVEDVEEN
jgi:hypothetical protein